MKIKILSAVLFFTLSGCTEQPIVPQMTGFCYQRIAEPEDETGKDRNDLIMCLDDGTVRARKYFSNHLKLSTVCYQSGTYTVTPEYLGNLKLHEGLCENGNRYKPYEAVCSLYPNNDLTCKNSEGELNWKYIHIEYGRDD